MGQIATFQTAHPRLPFGSAFELVALFTFRTFALRMFLVREKIPTGSEKLVKINVNHLSESDEVLDMTIQIDLCVEYPKSKMSCDNTFDVTCFTEAVRK